MKKRTMLIITAILVVLVVASITAVFIIEKLSRQSYTVEVFGTVFKEENSESNVIDIDLIRPPRTVVIPGETTYPDSIIQNTADFDIYIRANYRVEVRDKDNKSIFGFSDDVDIDVNEGWEFNGRYWIYQGVLKSGEEIPGPIKSIKYDDDFSRHLDYNVYIPVLVECAAAEGDIDEIDNWPNKNIKKIKIEDWIDKEVSWTQKIEIPIK